MQALAGIAEAFSSLREPRPALIEAIPIELRNEPAALCQSDSRGAAKRRITAAPAFN